MILFHGMVGTAAHGEVECVGVRYTRREMSQAGARKIGGFLWDVGQRLDEITSVNGTNPPMPNAEGWLVRPVVAGADPTTKKRVMDSFSSVLREVDEVVPISELDTIAGDPSAREYAAKKGRSYDGQDYLGPARFALRAEVRAEQ